jgi:hypothetical protein
MRRPILSLGACLLVASTALAQNSGETAGSSTPPVAVGQTFKKFEFPVYANGELKYTLYANEAKGVTQNRAETTDLRIDVYDNGTKTTTITSPKADLYVAEQKMRTKNTVHILRDDMDATSQDCDFDVKAKKFLLRTRVKVLLKHFDVGATSHPENAKPGVAQAADPTPAATPDSMATPAPTPAPVPEPAGAVSPDNAVVAPAPAPMPSMPGNFPDTNAAPLSPSGSMTK